MSDETYSAEFGPRKTTDKPVSEMCSYELMLNNCYVENKNAMYRDFDETHDIRSLIRDIARSMRVYLTDDPELLDIALFDYLDDALDTTTGILGLLYSLLWSKAELYEKLKRYEDAEERGEIGRVPRWIPVMERLPEDEDEFVLVIVDGIYEGIGFDGALELATFNPTEGWILEMYPEAKITVKYWMPLPEAPEVEVATSANVPDNAEHYVCCDAVIPEGRQICPACESGG